MAGPEIQTELNVAIDENPKSTLLITPAGDLLSKVILFSTWLPTSDEPALTKSTADFIFGVFSHMILYNFTSVAFSTLGFEHFPCSIELLSKMLIEQMKLQLIRTNRPFHVKIMVEPNQTDIYTALSQQMLSPGVGVGAEFSLPATWERSDGHQKRFVVSPTSDEYQKIKAMFDQAMGGRNIQLIRIERIQNERWYWEYIAHKRDFEQRLNTDTEKRMYHGCPAQAAQSIIEGCFNRSYAGINGEKHFG